MLDILAHNLPLSEDKLASAWDANNLQEVWMCLSILTAPSRHYSSSSLMVEAKTQNHRCYHSQVHQVAVAALLCCRLRAGTMPSGSRPLLATCQSDWDIAAFDPALMASSWLGRGKSVCTASICGCLGKFHDRLSPPLKKTISSELLSESLQLPFQATKGMRQARQRQI